MQTLHSIGLALALLGIILLLGCIALSTSAAPALIPMGLIAGILGTVVLLVSSAAKGQGGKKE